MDNIDEWIKNFDLFDIDYINNPFPYLDAAREKGHIAWTSKLNLNWMTTSYDALVEIAHDYESFSSAQGISIVHFDSDVHHALAVPLTADPPLHEESKKVITRWLTPLKVKEYEPITRDICKKLIEKKINLNQIDIANDYAKHIPIEIIADILSIEQKDIQKFTNWIDVILTESSDIENRNACRKELAIFLFQNVLKFKENPQDNFISSLFNSSLNEIQITGVCASLFVAGIDTTWSTIGTILWHLAENPDHLEYFKNNPDNRYFMMEELLRYYSPVIVTRTVTKDMDYKGCPMKSGDKIVLNYTAANRDPSLMKDADKIILDRKMNRHVAFGSGIHRCIGANLARMEIMVAVETWLDYIPNFKLSNDAPVVWTGGQVRGPRKLLVQF